VESSLGKIYEHYDRGIPEGGVVVYEWRHSTGGSVPFATASTLFSQVSHHSR